MIGIRIAEKRKDRKLTQSVLADAVGVTTAFISQIESGDRKPSYGLIIKICHQLDVPLEFILSGNTKTGGDPTSKLLTSVLPHLDDVAKKKVIEYIFQLSGVKHFSDFPFFNTPEEYARYVISLSKISDFPVDVFRIAENLGVQIVSADIKDEEGRLYKNQENPLILLNNACDYHERNKFTVAILLGHLVMPWHLSQTFSRAKEKKSLDYDDPLEIEARQFAGELMLPDALVKKDFKKIVPSIENFEKFAYEKYKCSMTALAHKYFKSYGAKAVYLTSDRLTITRSYAASFPYKLVERVPYGSLAHGFIENPASAKETRCGFVKGNIWFDNLSPNVEVYEESMLDPKFGVTITIIQLKKPNKRL
ncbi:XRE family transcriptional regulator [Trichlorobacter lovleyi]|uniref:XRE family transcriptional regulator n=1 Tax=Trichlorobacter lovleyi TaxID=313985 RepID=UPI0024815D45|nr:XRE family transcriptional regulator [Trichlorobacter lovleyi]